MLLSLGGSEEHTSITSEGDIVSETSWGNRVTIESVPYAVLMEANSVLVESYPVPGKLKTEIGSELTNRFEWRYYLRGQSGGKLKPGEGNYSPILFKKYIHRRLKYNQFNLQLNLLHKLVKSYV